MPAKGKTPGKRGRSAITGKYVKQSTVKAVKPRTTVNEAAKKPTKKPAKAAAKKPAKKPVKRSK